MLASHYDLISAFSLPSSYHVENRGLRGGIPGGGRSNAGMDALTEEYKDEFRAIDTNGDGHISVDELARYFGMSHEQVRIIYE